MDSIEYKEYSELKEIGIKNSLELGKNDFNLTERVIITNDGRQWDYIPEDGIYQQRTEKLVNIT
jgi:hypothetical protein